jgi:hypothetical protein
MKRSRHDSEYEKVRRSRPRPEFPDDRPDPAAPARVKEMFEEVKERLAEGNAAEERAERARAEEHTKRSKAFTLELIRREYDRLGITPPEPLVSLALLETIGWRIERVGDRFELMRP